jgi:uncharacterized protein YjbJ (UPF0337 family)
MTTQTNSNMTANFNETTMKGKWLEIKGDIQNLWGKITDDELEKTKGDIKSIAGLIQQRYGFAKETFSAKLNEIFKDFMHQTDSVRESVKDAVKNA